MEIIEPQALPTICDIAGIQRQLECGNIGHQPHHDVCLHLLAENTVSETRQRNYNFTMNNASIDELFVGKPRVWNRSRHVCWFQSKKLLQDVPGLHLLQGLLFKNKSSVFLNYGHSTMYCFCHATSLIFIFRSFRLYNSQFLNMSGKLCNKITTLVSQS